MLGIFDAFTNDAASKAASANKKLYQGYGDVGNQYLSGYQGQATGGVDQATGQLYKLYGDYQPAATSIFSDYGKTGDQYLTGAATDAQGALDKGLTAAEGDYGKGIDAVNGTLGGLGNKYGSAVDLYLGSLGLNGQGGIDAAKNAFTTGPGYQFAVDEATKAAANKAASLGIAGSGNTLDEVRNRAQGFANQEYGNFQNRLAGFLPYEADVGKTKASLLASLYPGLAGTESADAARRAALLTDLGASRTALAGNVAGNEAGILGATTGALAGATSADEAAKQKILSDTLSGRLGVAANQTSGLAGANNAEAQAAQSGSANFWNALATLGGTAAKGYFGGK